MMPSEQESTAIFRACVEGTRTLFELRPVIAPGEATGIVVDGREGNATIGAELINKIVLAALDAQLRALPQDKEADPDA